jgi:putative FmdB family regulatory protein
LIRAGCYGRADAADTCTLRHMPIYEYEREDGTRFDVRQSFSDDALETDPDTGQKIHRVISTPSVIYRNTVNTFTSYRSMPKTKKNAT